MKGQDEGMKLDMIKARLFCGEKQKIPWDLGSIFLIITIVVLTAYGVNGIYPFGNGSIARGDMVQQTIPAGMYYAWDVLHGRANPFFTWNTGLGMNISGAVSLGAVFSPLNIFLYFSTRSYLYHFVSFFVILKMIAIAYAMYFYLKKYSVDRFVYVMGSVLYAFGAASLVYFQIMLVMDAAFLLPLIMIGLDRLYDNKGMLFFIIVFALAMMINVYTGCITLVYLLLSSGAKTFISGDGRSTESKRWILRLGTSVLVAILLSAVISLPALHSIMEAPRSGKDGFLTIYRTALKSQWSEGEWSTVRRLCVNMALPCAAMVGYFLTAGKRKNYRKIYKSYIFQLSCLMISVVIPAIELLWHGGTRACWPVRFIYIITFVMIDFAVLLYQDQSEALSKKIKASSQDWRSVLLCVAAVVLGGGLFYRLYVAYCNQPIYSKWGDGFLCFFVEAVCAGVYLFFLKVHINKNVLWIVLCVQLTVTSVISFAPNKDNATVFSYHYLKQVDQVSKNMKVKTDSFERIKNIDYKLDHIDYPLVLGRQSISNYWHVIAPNLQPSLSALGYSINWTQLLDTGGTIFSDTLLHIQYALSYRELSDSMYSLCENIDSGEGELLHLYQNKLQFPFVIETDTRQMEPADEKFATQNILYQIVTGSSDKLIQDVSGDINGNVYNVHIGKGRKVLYFYGTNSMDQPITIKVNGKNIYIPNSNTSENINYPSDFGNGFLCLGSFEDENVMVEFDGNANVYQLHLGWLDYDMLQTASKNVQDQSKNIISLKKTHTGLRLKLKNIDKKYIFVPISADRGWSCRVNGKKTKLYSVDGMLSIPVQKDTDSIELKYCSPGRKTGGIVSMATLLICLLGLFAKRQEIRLKLLKVTDILSSIAYMVFGIVYLIFMTVWFAIPILYYLERIFIT